MLLELDRAFRLKSRFSFNQGHILLIELIQIRKKMPQQY